MTEVVDERTKLLKGIVYEMGEMEEVSRVARDKRG